MLLLTLTSSPSVTHISGNIFLQHCLLPGAELADGCHRRPREDYIVRPSLLSWSFPFLPFGSLRPVHDAPRKRSSQECWYGLLRIYRRIIHLRILLWCVLARDMRLIHNFVNRSICCALRRIGRNLYVRFLLPASRLICIKA